MARPIKLEARIQIAAPMPKLEADGVSRAVASTAVAPTPMPSAFSISPIATATTTPAKTAPHDTLKGRLGAPSAVTTPPDVTPWRIPEEAGIKNVLRLKGARGSVHRLDIKALLRPVGRLA